MGTEELTEIFRTYNIPIDSSVLRSVLEDEDQGRLLAEWAKSHLTPDTLLTKDELNSYLSLERNGKAESLAASADLSTVLPLSDEAIQHAIEELTRSTDAINKQTETLRQQQDALDRLLSASGKNGDARADLEVRRLHKWESDRKALNTAVELLSQGLDYRISEIEQQGKSTSEGVTDIVEAMLRSDDKLLSSLQKLGLELDTEDPEETESVAKLRDICARLIKYTVECLRTKLDRVYLEGLGSFPQSGHKREASKEDVTARQDELEELYSEILPVAQMSVEQQWLEPSLRSLSAKNGSSLDRSAEALRYILECFDYLLDRTERVCDRVSAVKAHENATTAVVATAKEELSSPVASLPKRHGNISSPTRRPRSLILDNLMTPAPSRTAPPPTRSRRRSSGDVLHDAPLEQLLGELALDLPSPADPSSAPNPAQAQSAYLHNTLASRAHKSADVARAVQNSLERDASARLRDARVALQLVRDSVLAESPFAEVRLVDPGIEASIGVLAQEAHGVASRLAGVEKEAAVVGRGRNARREEIVRRWGGRGPVGG